MLQAYTSSSSLNLVTPISSTTTLSSRNDIYGTRKLGFGSRSQVTLAIHDPPTIPLRVDSLPIPAKKVNMANTDSMSRLHELFAQGLPVRDVEGVLEEFAWRSLLRGVCVREWCSELKYILDQFPPNRTVLSTFELPHICLMYPYLTSSPLTSAYNNAYPAPLVAVAYLQCLTRDMTVDALLNVDSADENAPARVMELCIEYIGHVWRTEWSRGIFGGALADTLSKELTDLDRETFQLVRDPYLRAFLKPLIQRIRFNLGLVSPTQLVSYFPAQNGRRSPSGQSLTDAYYISIAYARRRLNSAVPVQKVVDDLYFIRDRVPTEALANHVEEVMKHMGIAGRAVEVTTPPSVYMYLPEDEPMQEKKGKKKDNRKSAFSFLSKKSPRGTSPTPPSPRFHRAKSPLGNSLDLPPGFSPDRRPSLPGPVHTSTVNPPKSPSMTNVLYPFRPARSTASLMSEQDGDAAELLSNIMAFGGDKSDVGLILNDYLLEKRHLLHIHTNGAGDWFLGNGKENAAIVIDAMDGKLVGKKDVMQLAETFVQLRTAYGLPDASVEQQTAEKGLAKQWKKDQDKRASFNASLHNVQMLQEAIAAHEALSNRTATPSTSSEKSKYKLVPVLEALYTDESAAGSETEGAETEQASETEAASTAASEDGTETERESGDVLAMLDVPDTALERRRSSNSQRLSTLSGLRQEYRNSVASTYAFSIKEATKQHYHPAQAIAWELRQIASDDGSTSGSARDQYLGGRIRSSSQSSGSTLEARPGTSTGHYSRAHTAYPLPPSLKNRQRSLRGRPSHTSVRSRSTVRTSRSDPSAAEPPPDSPLPESHPGARPRSSDSTHSFFSALSLETRLTGEALAQLQDGETARRLSGPLFPNDGGASVAKDRRISRIQAEVANLGSGSVGDAEDDYTPHPSPKSVPSHITPVLPRQISNSSLACPGTDSNSSSSTRTTPIVRPAPLVGEVDKTGINRAKNGLPLAGILSLFTDVLMRKARGDGDEDDSRQLEGQVEKAVRDFVDGEKRFAQQNGGWDAEDMRRVVWLLRQVAALIDDPILQYPINREIFHLTQSSSASTNSSPRTTLSKASSRSTFSMSTPSLLLPEQNAGLGLGLGTINRLRQQNPGASASAINLGMPLTFTNNSRTRLSPIPSVPSSRSQSSLSLYSTETHEQAEMDNTTRPVVTISVPASDDDISPSLTHVETPRTANSFSTIRDTADSSRSSVPKLAINTASVKSETISLDSDDEKAKEPQSAGAESFGADSLTPAKKADSPVKFDAPWGRSRPSSPMISSPGASPGASPRPGQMGLFEEKMREWGSSYASPTEPSVGVKRHDSFASVRTFGRPGEITPGGGGNNGNGKRFSADSVFTSERAESLQKRVSGDGDTAGLWDLRQALEASARTADDAAKRVSFLAPEVGAMARAQMEAEGKKVKVALGLEGDVKRARRKSGWL